MKTSWLVRIVLPSSVLAVMTVTAAVVFAQSPTTRTGNTGERTMAFTLETQSFPKGGEIPKKFSCDGEDLSPELSWSEPPAGTQSLALIADDPDAPVGTWTHWVAYDLPPGTRGLPEGAGKGDTLPGGGHQGKNDFRRSGYGGPCPPPGKPHRYFFKLYALDTKVNLKPGASKQELESAMKGHILAQAEITGTFKR